MSGTRLVTVFGGSGFVGRYVAQALLAKGDRVRFAERDPRKAFFLKPLGNLGQTQFAAADVTDFTSVQRVVEGSHAVIDLAGAFGGMADPVNAKGAGNVARAAKEAGADSLVHISAIGADPKSPSAYGRSKGDGEAAVREAFPAATILRPSIIFGREDKFINRFAGMIRALPYIPVVRGDAQFQPVFVGDVAKAASDALGEGSSFAGKTYELGGPEVLTMSELFEWIAEQIGREPTFLPLPDAVSGLMATLTGWAPLAPITRDQWLMLGVPNIVNPKAHSLKDFGIAPTPLSAVAEGWLTSYRRHGRFAGRAAA